MLAGEAAVERKAAACGVTCGDAAVSCGGASCGGVSCGGVSCGDDNGHTVVSYVGYGQGEYMAETTYKYVGKGAGDVNMVAVAVSTGWYKWLLVIPMVLAILFLIQPESPTTTTTPANDLHVRSCSVFGDPHALSFDGQKTDLYTAGEFWMVKSDTVHIQGKYAPTQATNGLSVTKQIAVAGPFLKGHTLIVGEEHTTWDGKLIMPGFPATFHDPSGLLDIVYDANGETLQAGREGKDRHVLHITLPDSVTLQINRWNEPGEGRYINVRINMPPQPNQDGDCGNFNGIAMDDRRIAVRKRMGMGGVAAEDLLFPGPKTPVDLGIENCDDETLTRAHEACKKVTTSFWPSMPCLKKVCNGMPAA